MFEGIGNLRVALFSMKQSDHPLQDAMDYGMEKGYLVLLIHADDPCYATRLSTGSRPRARPASKPASGRNTPQFPQLRSFPAASVETAGRVPGYSGGGSTPR